MQAGRRGASSTSQGRESTSFNHEFQSDPGFSWTSTYAARSPPKSQESRQQVAQALIHPDKEAMTVKRSHGKNNAHFRKFGKLRDGSIIAVKRATKNMYDRHLSEEFRSEIQTLSKVEHLNLVKFLGYLEHEDERLILVEYVNNGSLREHLDGLRGEPLEFSQRLNIAIDIVHAVSYLHGYTDHPIIHRDIKSSNILLTDQLRAKVADFGFARLAPDNTEATHVSTMVKGTAGYVDPEYMRTNQLTDRSDVYSFGVLLVELLTGRRPIERGRGRHQRLTTQWALRKCRDGDAVVAMDARMRRTSAVVAAMEKVTALAAECTAPDRAARPAMRRCAEVLWSIRRDFQHEQQRATAAAAAGARGKRHDGSTYGPSITSLKE
uniref:non-specific serine/threonine protein kinase n=1 Tax=Oryza glumipatula TaxID=40148 RepID=A0A0D9YHD6_9ORYZ